MRRDNDRPGNELSLRKVSVQKRRWQKRKRKPKRQGSRAQRGKRLPERQRRSRLYWNNHPIHGKDG